MSGEVSKGIMSEYKVMFRLGHCYVGQCEESTWYVVFSGPFKDCEEYIASHPHSNNICPKCEKHMGNNVVRENLIVMGIEQNPAKETTMIVHGASGAR